MPARLTFSICQSQPQKLQILRRQCCLDMTGQILVLPVWYMVLVQMAQLDIPLTLSKRRASNPWLNGPQDVMIRHHTGSN